MCTVLVLQRPDDPWPLLIGANRDERLGRAFDPPARWWPDAPGIVAGRDRAGGGSWFGVNDDGVVATIVNGLDRLGPQPGKRSRGEIVLRALGEPDAPSAVRAIVAVAAGRYRGFTLLVADRVTAFVVTNDERSLDVRRLAPGHHMITPDGCDVPDSPRYVAHFDAFRDTPPPAPGEQDWTGWIDLLRQVDDDDPHRAMTVVTGRDFGTVSSTLLGLAADVSAPPDLLFANGPPTRAGYERVAIPLVHAGDGEHR